MDVAGLIQPFVAAAVGSGAAGTIVKALFARWLKAQEELRNYEKQAQERTNERLSRELKAVRETTDKGGREYILHRQETVQRLVALEAEVAELRDSYREMHENLEDKFDKKFEQLRNKLERLSGGMLVLGAGISQRTGKLVQRQIDGPEGFTTTGEDTGDN